MLSEPDRSDAPAPRPARPRRAAALRLAGDDGRTAGGPARPDPEAVVADLREQLAAARRETGAARESARRAHRDSARLVRLLTALSRPAVDATALVTSALEAVSEAFGADVVCLVRAAVPVAAADVDHVVVAACGFPQGGALALPTLPAELAVAGPAATSHPATCGGWSGEGLELEVSGVVIRSGARLVLDPADASAGMLLVLRAKTDTFSPTELKMLQSLTERLHAAVQALERRSAAEVLATAGAHLTQHQDSAHLCREAAALLVALTEAEWAGVAEVRDGRAHLVAQTGPLGVDLAPHWPRKTEDLLGWERLREGRSHLCQDLASVVDHPDRPPHSGVRTVMNVPVVAEGATQLVLTALHRTPSAFSRVTVEAVEQLSSALSGALVSSRLHKALRASEQSARHRATHDTLTGLANRALFLEELERRLAPRSTEDGDPGTVPDHPRDAVDPTPSTPADGIAVLFCDLDGFKAVNDQLGHDAGDQLLCQVSQRLSAAVRSDDLLARLGGDEFVVLLDDVPDAVAVRPVAERLLAVLSEPFSLSRHDGGVEVVRVGGSLGGASTVRGAHPHQRASDLLRRADTAMYAAKRAGGGQVCTDVASGTDSRMAG
ncbi:diguanylate cyclase domain-containing protein [Quadrisphaera sp. INWT6]|uniref:diguanylate cyclase domain-containing protein n=1 Tax=Quadrisphaera sp. INWT6 TaxID=2596917 RepID=UPI002102EAAB|nr:diguanylate cyclase [Quadrisphaera sp. INWT6]